MQKKLIFALTVVLIIMMPISLKTKAAEGSSISVFIDGRQIQFDAEPVIVDDRTLVPIRTVAETVGADVSWEALTRTAIIRRASKEIKIVIGQNAALVNGVTVPLDVPAMISEDRTMLPLRFVAEQLSQDVRYDATTRSVYITEDNSFEGDSNIRAWILGCSAVLAEVNKGDPYSIGMCGRSAATRDWARQALNGWNCGSREDVIETIKLIADDGHNVSFKSDAALLNSLTDKAFDELAAQAQGDDKYMLPYVKSLDEKWGNKGIKAWDWFRMIHLASWGYRAGYLELREAYELAEPVAQGLKATFSSWDEATENYMDGYAYWSRADVAASDTEYKNRLRIYEDLKVRRDTDGVLFDHKVWIEPVRGVGKG